MVCRTLILLSIATLCFYSVSALESLTANTDLLRHLDNEDYGEFLLGMEEMRRQTRQRREAKQNLQQAKNRQTDFFAGADFESKTLGVGGLDDVLAEVKRRIWIPLAAPSGLLEELGITPVRGLLLYGDPGCGKTLVAKTIGKLLSPSRQVTMVSGPELIDQYLGASEKNIRHLFDDPPPLYNHIRLSESDGGVAVSKVALHVVIMDEFDAMAKRRGNRHGSDAGKAMDSVVNQLLAKLDGLEPLPVPTLVIALTNQRNLIDPALLRPGRFEVHIEVPPPSTPGQRKSILHVHMKTMMEAGRLLVRDAPTVSIQVTNNKDNEDSNTLLSYDELLDQLATNSEGFTGASLAGVVRAAASHALERSIGGDSSNNNNQHNNTSMLECMVTQNDLHLAVKDMRSSSSLNDQKNVSTNNEDGYAIPA